MKIKRSELLELISLAILSGGEARDKALDLLYKLNNEPPEAYEFEDSSFVRHASWHKGTLVVTLTSGTYAYNDVPRSVFKEFIKAHSAGTFYNERIKGVY